MAEYDRNAVLRLASQVKATGHWLTPQGAKAVVGLLLENEALLVDIRERCRGKSDSLAADILRLFP